jgi:hypothetical protein
MFLGLWCTSSETVVNDEAKGRAVHADGLEAVKNRCRGLTKGLEKLGD